MLSDLTRVVFSKFLKLKPSEEKCSVKHSAHSLNLQGMALDFFILAGIQPVRIKRIGYDYFEKQFLIYDTKRTSKFN